MNVSPTKIAARANKMVLARRGLGSQQRRQGGSDGNEDVYGKGRTQKPAGITFKGTTWFNLDYTSVQRPRIDDGEYRKTSLRR